ncbi:hypothetical protein [Planktotalea sp.]|uniref:hypothetical protein n=1 Tax=Planktotalea sp. TaxID=2029877 RepID=UPI0025E26E42|nr:hypothetical protein [Planktotalea sp.]
MKTLSTFSAIACLLASTSQADVLVRFIEGAPKDRFVISADTNACAGVAKTVTIDLVTSSGGLIFDVTGQGSGVEVFQPFELTSGADKVTKASKLRDGDQVLTLELSQVSKDMPVSFTTDLDDTQAGRQITVSGSEITGAMVNVTQNGKMYVGTFESDARARVATQACAS